MKRRMSALEITLIVLGSPIWLSLGVALLAVILSLCVAVWAIIISVWSVFASFVGASIGALLSGVLFILTEKGISGIALLGASAFFLGLSLFTLALSRALTRGVCFLTKEAALSLKNHLFRRGEVI